MPQRSLEAIVKKRLKQHKRERIVLYLLIALGAVLTLAGIGVFLYVGQLTIVQKVYAAPTGNFMMSQLKLLCGFAKLLGVVLSLVGVASIIMPLDRLTFSKESYRMALYISDRKEE